MKVKDIVCGSLYEDLVCAAQIPMLKKEKEDIFDNRWKRVYYVLSCVNLAVFK